MNSFVLHAMPWPVAVASLFSQYFRDISQVKEAFYVRCLKKKSSLRHNLWFPWSSQVTFTSKHLTLV